MLDGGDKEEGEAKQDEVGYGKGVDEGSNGGIKKKPNPVGTGENCPINQGSDHDGGPDYLGFVDIL